MKFNVMANSRNEVFVRLNDESCLFWITRYGLGLNKTGWPQDGVDYGAHNCLKITGTDMEWS